MTVDLKCPHCGSKAFTDYGDGLVACQRCYVQFDLNQQQCPNCGSLLPEGAAVCLQCGTDLRGEAASRIVEERLTTADDWRRARLAMIQQQRTEAEEASRRRMDAWWEKDQKRREAEHLEHLARQRRERKALITALVIVVIVLLIAAISLIVYLSTQPDPTPTTLLFQRSIGS
jgi:uncharacterized Zn finger protein (UPF0148 family)